MSLCEGTSAFMSFSTSAHGKASVWQLDAIEVAAGGLASVGVDRGAYG